MKGIAGNVRAWDGLWAAMQDAGIQPDYNGGVREPEGWLPTDPATGVNWGASAVRTVECLQGTRLTAEQIGLISTLVRDVVRATLVACA